MAEDDADPVIHRLQFGELAREHRDAAGLDSREADTLLGGYPGQLSKIETGVIAAKPQYVEAMITLYRLTGRDADDLRALGAAARRRSRSEHASTKDLQYVALERAASEIRMAYNEVPGLLQTEEFAYAVLSQSPMVTGGEARDRAVARAQRSTSLVHPNGPKMWIVLGEEALYRQVGGIEVLGRQIERLLEMAGMPNVSLRIHPWTAGVCAALGCPFTLLYIKPARTIAYVEALTRPDYVKATGPYQAAFDQAYRAAENEGGSRAILAKRISDLRQGS